MNQTIAKRSILLVGLLIAASLAWIATNGLSKPATASAGPVQDATALAEAQREVSVLARAADPAKDTLPAQLADGPLMNDAPIDLASARLVRGVGRTTWLASSADGRSVCEIAGGAMACPPVDEIVARGLSPIVFSRRGEAVHVSGVAIDSVTAVEVLADGRTTTVPVIDNLFTLDVDAWPQGLRWTGPSGPESFSFPQLEG
jgi:hypothetical protein